MHLGSTCLQNVPAELLVVISGVEVEHRRQLIITSPVEKTNTTEHEKDKQRENVNDNIDCSDGPYLWHRVKG